MSRLCRLGSATATVAAVLCLLLGSVPAASAAPPASPDVSPTGKNPQAPTSTEGDRRSRAKPPRIENLEEMVIEGRVPKPQPTVITQRASMKYRRRPLKRSFVDRIVHSVDEPPF